MLNTFRQLWDILTPQARRRFVAVLLLVLAMTAIETAGVVSIMPFLAVLGNPDLVTEQPQMATNDTLGQVPLYLVEATGYAGLVALVLVWRGDDLGQMLPVIRLYGFAAYRMLPASGRSLIWCRSVGKQFYFDQKNPCSNEH